MNQTVQIQRRNGNSAIPDTTVSFEAKLRNAGKVLETDQLEILQINVGKLCNQACKHCHVDASPTRTEIMRRETIDACLRIVSDHDTRTVDITGGAPELIPDFRYLVASLHKLNCEIIVRHNLTVMFEDGQEDLPGFFGENGVVVVSSLPYFQQQQTDAQRGSGVFEKSIEALKRLNQVGYGKDASGLRLNLVYNPVGAFLPPEQSSIEADFKRELSDRFGVEFNELYTITNMPIARYLDWLRRSGNESKYMSKLIGAFNPSTVDGLMCRNTLSVDWRGRLFDCDFNQMLDIRSSEEIGATVFDFEPSKYGGREIMTNNHCFGCTAGLGSSCGGTVSD